MLRAYPELRAFAASAALAGLAEGAFTVLLGVHVYARTHDLIALSWLGVAEAVPAIGLVLLGGHVADRAPRRLIAALTRGLLAVVAALLAVGAAWDTLTPIYLLAALAGAVRAFEDPSTAGLEAEILPAENATRAVSLIAAYARVSGLAGPIAGGFAYEAAGPVPAFAAVAVILFLSAAVLMIGIAARSAPRRARAPILPAIVEGLRYVFSSQVIAGSMALDLFAVFFGGAAGLFPAYAEDILMVGPGGVGLLRAATAAGALTAMIVATRHPPRAHSGLWLHGAVAGFGFGIIVFALSRDLVLSLAALFVVGACDGVSVVIRRAIVRMAAPDGLRGRVASVRGLFLSGANELGAAESGFAAALIGLVPAVWSGGMLTIVIAGVTAWRAPLLRRLDLRELERLRTREIR